MSLLIVAMDNTIVNVALPSIRRDLHSSLSGLQWTIDAYTIVLASLLLLSGSTADRLGRRRVFQAGLLLFVAGSLLCSLAPSLAQWLSLVHDTRSSVYDRGARGIGRCARPEEIDDRSDD